MTEYDNTNRGASFPPFPTQQLILQGKMNVEGHDKKVVLVKDQTKSGKVLIEVYQKIGVLFPNDKKGNENAPDYTGPLSEVLVMNEDKRLAAWKKMKDDRPFMTLSVSDAQNSVGSQAQPQQSVSQAPSDLDKDFIPF